MGNNLTSVCQQPVQETKYTVETPAYESTTFPVEPAEPKQAYEQGQNAVEATVETKVDEIEATAAEINDAVEAKVEELKEHLEKAVEETAKTETTVDAPLDLVGEKDQTVEGDVKKPCVTPLKVVFELKGARKTVDFTHNELGFECGQPTGCCASIKPVTVTRVTPGGQAVSLGLARGAIIRQVDGKDIAELKQMQGLVETYKATLPAPGVSN